MSLKHIKLFEQFKNSKLENEETEVTSVNEEYEKPEDFPGKFRGTEMEKKEKAEGETWNGYDSNNYPQYTGKSADELNAWYDKQRALAKEGKGIVIKAGDTYIAVAKYKNGLYYNLGTVDPSKFIKKDTPPEKEKEEIGELIKIKTLLPEIPDNLPVIEPIGEPEYNIVPIKALTFKGKVSRHKSPHIRAEFGKKTPDSLKKVGTINKYDEIGYVENDKLIYFNDHEGNAWVHNKETGERNKANPAKLAKYKKPLNKKVLKQKLARLGLKIKA